MHKCILHFRLISNERVSFLLYLSARPILSITYSNNLFMQVTFSINRTTKVNLTEIIEAKSF